MALFSKRKAERKDERLDRRRSLAGVPVISGNVAIRDADGGNLSLTVGMRRGNGFLDRFRPPVSTKRISLDELGSFVVRRIDGRAAVQDIIDAFVAEYQTNRREAELCIVEFLKSLLERSVIGIAIK